MYRITNRGNSTEVLIYDDIGEGFFGGISAKQVKEDLADISSPVVNVRINSPGGSVHDGFAIANALKDHPARIEIDVDALAASIASYIAIEAADELRMADNSMLMIHNAWSVTAGDAAEMRRAAEVLDKHNDIIVESYSRKTGEGTEQVQAWMNAETWFNAEEAADAGFADAVTEDSTAAAAWFDPSRFQNTPQRLLDSMPAKPTAGAENTWMRNLAKDRLRLTRLRR